MFYCRLIQRASFRSQSCCWQPLFLVFVFGSKKWKDAWRLVHPVCRRSSSFTLPCKYRRPSPRLERLTTFSDTITLALRTAGHYGLALLVPNKPSLLSFTLENYQGATWITLGALLVGAFAFFLRYSWKSHREWTWLAVCVFLVYLPISNFPTIPSFVVGPYRMQKRERRPHVCLGSFARRRLPPSDVCWWEHFAPT